MRNLQQLYRACVLIIGHEINFSHCINPGEKPKIHFMKFEIYLTGNKIRKRENRAYTKHTKLLKQQ